MTMYKYLVDIGEMRLEVTVEAVNTTAAVVCLKETYPEASLIQLYEDNVIPFPLLNNVIHVDFKAKMRIA